VDVFASSITLADDAAPAPAILTGDFGDGHAHGGSLAGTVEASDLGSGVRRVDVTFAGITRTSSPACDFSMPRPRPARHGFDIEADAGRLAGGPHPLTVTVTDGSGRSTTTHSDVLVAHARAGAREPLSSRPSMKCFVFTTTSAKASALARRRGRTVPMRVDPCDAQRRV
jgi:hypothetical protein